MPSSRPNARTDVPRGARGPERGLGRARSAVALAAAVALFVLAKGHAQDAPPAAPLVARLRELVQASGLADRVGIAVVDTADGRPVFQFHADRPLNPASNQKLVTAFAALRTLGADFRMRTAVYGRIEGDAVTGGLALRGFGDPTLTHGDLMALAREVADQGVRRIDRVIVDATYFDDQVLPPAFEQQPHEVAAFRAPISAVAVDRNAYVLRVLPGPEVGAPAVVRLAGAAYFDVDNRITTSEPGAPNVIADQRDAGPRMALRLRGTVPIHVRGVSYRRRIENPLPWVGHVFAEALRAQGIRVGDRVEVGPTPDGAALLASRQSPPLASMLEAVGKHSDNFVAEMIFKVMGAERHRPGRAEDGVAAVRAALQDAGLSLERMQIVNGSGLFEGNRVSAQQLADLLRAAYHDPSIRAEYVAHLAIAGVDGTLARRLRDLPVPRVVRAKTGTLNAVVALSGYVLGPRPERAYAFSVLANDVQGQHGPARALADGIARALVEDLHRR
ncbi:MAG TPA: D-alanyl-D-alanine carboxypeptidase/D-alanyl-D-alanine-endopeptidase [Sandaracinaceae bacterium]